MLVHVVSALFDINPSMTTHMPVHLWKKCVATLLDILALLEENPHISLDEHFDGGEAERTGAPLCFVAAIWTCSSSERS